MARTHILKAFLPGIALAQGMADGARLAVAAPRAETAPAPTPTPAAKAKRLLSPTRLAKVKPIRTTTNEASLTYKQGKTDVTLSIGPESHGPLAFWSVKTTNGKTTTEASTVLDTKYPFATTYRQTDIRANGDFAFEAADISRLGYEGVPEKLSSSSRP